MPDFMLVETGSKEPEMINLSLIRSFVSQGCITKVTFIDGAHMEIPMTFCAFIKKIEGISDGQAQKNIEHKFTDDGRWIRHSRGLWDLTRGGIRHRKSKEIITFQDKANGKDLADYIAETRPYSEEEMVDFRNVLEYALDFPD